MRDPRLLRRRRRVDLAKDLDQVALGTVGAVHECEDSDEQREERDQREEDLVRDRAGEEAALGLAEAHDYGTRATSGAG